MRVLLWGVIILCYLFASYTDLRTYLVYNFTWMIAALAAVGLCILQRNRLGSLVDLGCFMLLQFKFFGKTFGKADMYAFLVGAICITSMGGGLKEDLQFMLLAYVGLGIVQLLKHNVGRNGNLKKPVAFLPYITLALFSFVWYHISG